MLKRLLDGLVFGTGFGIAFVIVWVAGIYFILPTLVENRFKPIISTQPNKITNSNENIVTEAPSIRDLGTYLGSTGFYVDDFSNDEGKVLSGGNGIIRGIAQVNEKPLEGLKLRLALNGSIFSQWAITDKTGVYQISVPYGEYKIDGFDLDSSTANRVLSNKIDHPDHNYLAEKFVVKEGQEGQGLKLKFVDPIIRSMGKNRYLKGEKVILKWEPYPEANQYTIQIYEKPDQKSLNSKPLFNWRQTPEVSEPELDLSKYSIDLKPGYFYVFEAEARDNRGSVLSVTRRNHFGYDFKIEE